MVNHILVRFVVWSRITEIRLKTKTGASAEVWSRNFQKQGVQKKAKVWFIYSLRNLPEMAKSRVLALSCGILQLQGLGRFRYFSA